MSAINAEHDYIAKWRLASRGGWSMAMLNVAGAYRRIGQHQRAFKWFKKATEYGDGSGYLEVGYCYHVGLGTRKNIMKAEQAYRTALVNRYITIAEKEETRYLLAALLLKRDTNVNLRSVRALLRNANKNNDYPQARELLFRLSIRNMTFQVCLCRRYLKKRIAILRCPIHGHRSG